ncbi:GINS complex protein [Toxoplasma gondii ARI]|uniref:GINS complex protein n=3 Tax=Toxoplasma gondii TaxID=5811 RepID=A0A2G8XYX9_TOXGO|nr:GINS complex protein [Toxoplasma gondii MAS]KYF43831.1 GINS complex protein [Toxoplasma gondii ARI]PIM00217.1 GINS complex protein [Toxoplasma gondii COUG]
MKRSTSGEDPLAFLAGRKKRNQNQSSSLFFQDSRRGSVSSQRATGGAFQPTPRSSHDRGFSRHTAGSRSDTPRASSSQPDSSQSSQSSSSQSQSSHRRGSVSRSAGRPGAGASFGLQRRRRRPSEDGDSAPSSQSSSGASHLPSSLSGLGGSAFSQSSGVHSDAATPQRGREETDRSSRARHEFRSVASSGSVRGDRDGTVSSHDKARGGRDTPPATPVDVVLEEARAPERSMDECFPVLVELPARGAAHLCNLGFHLLADDQLQRHLDSVLEWELEQSQRVPTGVTNGIHQASFDRLRGVLRLLCSYEGSSYKSPLPLSQEEDRDNREGCGFLVLPRKNGGERAVFVGHQELRGATLVRKETAAGLIEKIIQGGRFGDRSQESSLDLEVWPLRRSTEFLARRRSAFGSALDSLLMFRASSLCVIPCQLIMPLPSLDLQAVEGFELEEVAPGQLLLLPAWCAQVLYRRRLADVYLPRFLTAEQLKQTLSREEKMKEELSDLPESFFDIANLILFNPLLQPRGAEFDGEKERGLVLQIWDRRQTKISQIISRHRASDDRIAVTNIQPSETFLLSHVRFEAEDEVLGA